MSRTRTRAWLRIGLLTLAAVAATGCATPEEKAAEHLRKAQSFVKDGDYVKARLEARNALQVKPKNASASFLMATLLERENDVKGTLNYLQLAIDADPSHVEARTRLGTYFVLGRRQKDAREQADAVLRLAPDKADSHFLNARVLLLEDQPEASSAEAEKALALDPASGQIVGYVALMYARAGDLERAMAVIDQGIKATDTAQVEFMRNARISILTETGNADRALAELERMAKDYPGQSMYRMALAETYAGKGRIDDATRLVRELIASDPDRAQWRVTLAELLASAGRVGDAEAELNTAVKSLPQSTLLKLALARFYESAKRRDEALKLYGDLATTAPDLADKLTARNRIAALNVGVNDAESRRIADEILKDVPDNVDALMMRAAYRIQDGKFQDAVADLRAVLARQPQSTETLLMLARTHVFSDEGNLAKDNYRKLLEIEPGNADALRELGALLGGSGQTKEAETLLRAALRGNPKDTTASQSLVAALLQQKDFDAAATEAARMASAGDQSGIAEYQEGLALAAQRKNDEAIAAFRASLAKNPGAIPPLNALITLYAGLGRVGEAETYLKTRIRTNPKDERGRLLLGQLYASSNRNTEAEALYRRMLAENPQVPWAYIGLAGLHAENSDDWLDAIVAGHAANPGSPELSLALGGAYEKRAKYALAIQTYEKSLATRDNDFVASNLAALLLDVRTDAASHARALKLAQRFANDAHPLSKAVLGWAQYRNGDYPAAERTLQRAVAANPNIAQVHYFLGMTYLKSNNKAGARQELSTAIELGKKPDARFFGLDEAKTTLASL